jgi:hypothetical protein
MKLERIFLIRPAFDKRHVDPDKNYGIHGAEMLFIVKGERGAVQFVLYTNWQLPHVTKEWLKKDLGKPQGKYMTLWRPIPADVGYHSPKPMYEGQEPIGSKRINKPAMKRNTIRLINREGIEKLENFMEPTGTFTPCEWLDGKPCYYDGSGLAAEQYYNLLLRKGSEAVWRKLERYYRRTFHAKVSKGG